MFNLTKNEEPKIKFSPFLLKRMCFQIMSPLNDFHLDNFSDPNEYIIGKNN